MAAEDPRTAEVPALAGGGAHVCATTRWTLVLNAQEGSGDALEQLCRIYWPPVYYFIRARRPADDALDVTQSFFLDVLEKQRIGAADRVKGKFRDFLLASVKNFLNNEWDRRNAQKRGGGLDFISLDAAREDDNWANEPREKGDPTREYDRKWALTIVERTRARLRKEYGERGILFDELEPYLTERPNNLQDVAEKLRMSLNLTRVTLFRLRRRYGLLLREEVAQTLSGSHDIDEELRHLLAAYAG